MLRPGAMHLPDRAKHEEIHPHGNCTVKLQLACFTLRNGALLKDSLQSPVHKLWYNPVQDGIEFVRIMSAFTL
jgi:hypothetical protein